MASDPRTSTVMTSKPSGGGGGGGGGGAAAAAAGSILLGGEDDMDVDEEMPFSNLNNSNSNSNLIIISNNNNNNNLINNNGQGWISSGASAFLFVLKNEIIIPSPYPQHNSGPTSARFRNALNRVLQQPDVDVEAWQALLTEVNSCFKNIPNIHVENVETQARLDWVESCYGHFHRYFPYAYKQAVTIIEILMQQSARWGEPDGPLLDYYGGSTTTGRVSKRAQICEAKLEALLMEWLGLSNMEGQVAPMKPTPLPSVSSSAANQEMENNKQQQQHQQQQQFHLTGICSWVVELWLLYIKKRARDATRTAATMPSEQRSAYIRQATKQAYEVALPHCGFSHNNHLIWTAYLDFVKSWMPTTTTDLPSSSSNNNKNNNTAEYLASTQQQMLALRSVYQRLVTHPMTGLDQLWHEYEAWERSQSEALAQALTTEFAPKYQHARTVYLERNRVYNSSGELQLGQRLAVTPASSSSSSLGGATAAATTTTTTTTTATKKNSNTEGMAEENRLLMAWKKRCSYERTNPERLSATDLLIRIRSAYKEMACVMTRHAETWHMWSTFELFRNAIVAGGGAAAAAAAAGGGGTGTGTAGLADATPAEARSVLQLAQTWIPDSTLLVYAEAHIVELYCHNNNTSNTNNTNNNTTTNRQQECMKIMEQAMKHYPTTLGFILYQRMVRRYKGMDEARLVFGQARRVLLDPDAAATATSAASATAAMGSETKQQENEIHHHDDGGGRNSLAPTERRSGENKTTSGISTAGMTGIGTGTDGKPRTRWMVTNRLDPIVSSTISGAGAGAGASRAARETDDNKAGNGTKRSGSGGGGVPGTITWHLYAAHATMEHRINRCPEIATRVYELGLRKHASFLTKASYVNGYANILLELGDTMNLRALLTRAIAACEEAAAKNKNEHHRDSAAAAAAATSLASLWDMTLHFETMLSGSNPDGLINLEIVERKRWQAIMGPEIEDVATGGYARLVDTPLIGAQKSSIAEHLIRSEGYDVSSSIVNGLARSVNVLEVMGLVGNAADKERRRGGSSRAAHLIASMDDDILDAFVVDDDDNYMPGGLSDVSYCRRLTFANNLALYGGMGGEAGVAAEGGGGTRLLTARERMQQSSSVAGGSGAGAGAGVAGGPTSAMILAIQQMPEWLRPLSLLLPASRLRLPIVAKPPPHLIEIALTTLLQNTLPAERPRDDELVRGNKRKVGSRVVVGGGDSSDEENGIKSKSSGYGIAFRQRQRARMN